MLSKVGEVAYMPQFPKQLRIHLMFHVSLLKKAIWEYQVQGELPKELEITDVVDVCPDKVMGSRVTMQGVWMCVRV